MMRRFLPRNVTLYTRHLLQSSPHPNPTIPNPSLAASTHPRLRFYSDSSNNTPPEPLPESSALAELRKKDDSDEVKDVSNKGKREKNDFFSEFCCCLFGRLVTEKMNGKWKFLFLYWCFGFFFGFELVRDLSLKKFRFCRII
jgi:hypothetical protein